jgi:6-phosphogluconolactonase
MGNSRLCRGEYVIPQVRVSKSVVAEVLDILTGLLMSADPHEMHHVVLTGGGAGLSITAQLVNVAKKIPQQTWANTHFWWGDERFVESGSIDRNDFGIETSLGEFYIESNIHRIPASDQVQDATKSAESYIRELFDFETDGFPPQFTCVILGVGPDGHIASLFPGRPELDSRLIAMPVFDSPKPPPIRVTMGFLTLNNSQLTLLLLGGETKREALNAIVNPIGFIDKTPARGIEAAKLYAITDLSVSV